MMFWNKGCGWAHRQIMRRMRLKSNYKGIPAQYASKIERILDRLDAAKEPEDMDLPGYKFHPLKGDRMGAYAVFVNANWRITFEFDGQDAVNVNLEDYH
jgi:proteic killer suppression protein